MGRLTSVYWGGGGMGIHPIIGGMLQWTLILLHSIVHASPVHGEIERTSSLYL